MDKVEGYHWDVEYKLNFPITLLSIVNVLYFHDYIYVYTFNNINNDILCSKIIKKLS